ncbi:MAG: phosphoribosylformylglycinamidine cyclo-ligase [Spirochaetales bacterium]|nr:phosphoribosylformylglycinamidine cyclo-ligase [Spirochaetales bacterium]
MNGNESDAYAAAGVSTAAGARFVSTIKDRVHSTYNQGPGRVLSTLRGFAGLYDLSFLKNYKEPVLVSGTDGVGTKLQLARLFNRHNTIGVDLVAMCANDILVTGGQPLYFLDYIACGRLQVERMAEIIDGIVQGCKLAGAALLGGETAEHPGVMAVDDYDLAGFMVGVVEKKDLLDGADVAAGDLLLGLPSSGIHSNGLSLVRRIFLGDGDWQPEAWLARLTAKEQAFLREEVLLRPTEIYEALLRPILSRQSGERRLIKAMAHITGGGFFENIPRALPAGLQAVIDVQSWPRPSLFDELRSRGNLTLREMFHVFNMGIGMVLVVDPQNRAILSDLLNGPHYWIGRIENSQDETIVLNGL